MAGLEPIPQAGHWLNNGGEEARDILPDDTAFLVITFPDELGGFKAGVEVRAWVGDSSLPASRSFDVSIGGLPFPWFNDHVGG